MLCYFNKFSQVVQWEINLIDPVSFLARPESPTILSVETKVTDALVTWQFGDDGGLELIALKLQYKKGSQSKWQEIQIKPPNKVKYTIMDLEPNTNYNFRILATNSLGTSPPSSIYLAKTSKSGR